MCEQRNAALVRMTLGERKRSRELRWKFGRLDSCAARGGGRDRPYLAPVIVST